MSELRACIWRGDVDLRDNADDHEQLEVVGLLLDAAVKRVDRLWRTSAELRDGPRAAGILEARRLLCRARAALDSGSP
jgi:hypothetical protein